MSSCRWSRDIADQVLSSGTGGDSHMTAVVLVAVVPVAVAIANNKPEVRQDSPCPHSCAD